MPATPSSTVAELQQLLQRHDSPPTSMAGLPLHPALSAAFPTGLRAGAAYSLDGSFTAALALLAGPSQAGSWCAAVGLPHLSVEAAAQWGVDLDRLVLVPRLEPTQWTSVVATLIEVSDLVLAAPPEHISPGETSRVLARLRSCGSTLLITGPWPRAAAQLTARTVQWEGLHQGHGCIYGQRLRLEVVERHHRRCTEFDVPVRS